MLEHMFLKHFCVTGFFFYNFLVELPVIIYKTIL